MRLLSNSLLLHFTLIALSCVLFVEPTRSASPEDFKSRIAKLEGLHSMVHGPNCWDAALLSAGLINELRVVSAGEFWFWMKSPYCERLKPEAEPRPGDIGSLFSDRAGGQYHSFVVLGGDQVFSKNSPMANDDYRTQNYLDMFKPVYQTVAKICHGTQANLTANHCPFDVTYYRCQPLPTDFYGTHPRLAKIERDLKMIEIDIRHYVLKGDLSETPNLARELPRLESWILEIAPLFQSINVQEALAARALVLRMVGDLLVDVNVLGHLSPELESATDGADLLRIESAKHYVPKKLSDLN